MHDPLEHRAGCRPGCRCRRARRRSPGSRARPGSRGGTATRGLSATVLTTSSSPRPSKSAKRIERSSCSSSMPSAASRSAQKASASGEADAPDDAVHGAGAGTTGHGVRVLEERQVGARAALLLAVEQVVDVRVVLVHGLRDEPQPEHARVEVEVAGCVAGDRGDVMDAFHQHAGQCSSGSCECKYSARDDNARTTRVFPARSSVSGDGRAALARPRRDAARRVVRLPAHARRDHGADRRRPARARPARRSASTTCSCSSPRARPRACAWASSRGPSCCRRAG